MITKGFVTRLILLGNGVVLGVLIFIAWAIT